MSNQINNANKIHELFSEYCRRLISTGHTDPIVLRLRIDEISDGCPEAQELFTYVAGEDEEYTVFAKKIENTFKDFIKRLTVDLGYRVSVEIPSRNICMANPGTTYKDVSIEVSITPSHLVGLTQLKTLLGYHTK